MSSQKRFVQWALSSATPTQKALFLSEYADAFSEMHQSRGDGEYNLAPNTANKLALWEAYCAATGQDPALPGPSLV